MTYEKNKAYFAVMLGVGVALTVIFCGGGYGTTWHVSDYLEIFFANLLQPMIRSMNRTVKNGQ